MLLVRSSSYLQYTTNAYVKKSVVILINSLALFLKLTYSTKQRRLQKQTQSQKK
jgi:hypothetical protein